MTDRASKSLPRRRESGSDPRQLTETAKAESRPAAATARTTAADLRVKFDFAAFSQLELPPDYYFG